VSSTITSGWDFAAEYLDIDNERHRLASHGAREGVLRALNRIGEDAVAQRWIRERKAPIFFVGVDDSAYTCHVPTDLPKGAAIVILAAGVTTRPVDQVAAVAAHEIGHVWLRDHDLATGGQPEEVAADAKAAEWGFKRDLAASLSADVVAESDARKKAQLQARVDALR
jgi:hypothetical protein